MPVSSLTEADMLPAIAGIELLADSQGLERFVVVLRTLRAAVYAQRTGSLGSVCQEWARQERDRLLKEEPERNGNSPLN